MTLNDLPAPLIEHTLGQFGQEGAAGPSAT